MAHRIVARLGAGLAMAAVLIGMAAVPASASAPRVTRWVDDNHGIGPGPAACNTAAFTSIQAAIDASGPWDRVYVCPGTYSEQLTLDVPGVLVRAMPYRMATIQAPAVLAEPNGLAAIVTMTAVGAKLRGFHIDIDAGSLPAKTDPTPACAHVDIAVWAMAQRDRVRGNMIEVNGNETLSGSCGYDYGIVFGGSNATDRAAPSGLAALPPATGRIAFDWVTDFKQGGILVQGTGSSATLYRDTVRYLHVNDGGFCRPVDTACRPVATSSCVAASSNPAACGLAFGVAIEAGASATVQRDAIYSGPNAGAPVAQSGSTPALQYGVRLQNAAGGSRILDNVITRTILGIDAEVDSPVRPATPTPTGAEIGGNAFEANDTGISIEDSGNDVHDNTAADGFNGIDVLGTGGSGNDIHSNDFRGNIALDCNDGGPSGSETAGTSNTWTNDLGNNQQPSGICIPDPRT